jgi:tetratricopeptide (TPR) repeat protein
VRVALERARTATAIQVFATAAFDHEVEDALVKAKHQLTGLPRTSERERFAIEIELELGNHASRSQRFETALAHYEGATKMAKRAVSQWPADRRLAMQSAESSASVGWGRYQLGHYDDAALEFDSARALAQSLANGDPSNTLLQRQLARILSHEVTFELAAWDDPPKHHDTSVAPDPGGAPNPALAVPVCGAPPPNHLALAKQYNLLAIESLKQQGQRGEDKELSLLRAALDLQRGNVHAAEDHFKDALAAYRAAEQQARLTPDNAELAFFMVKVERARGDVYFASDDVALAGEAYRRGLDNARGLLALQPDNPSFVDEVAYALLDAAGCSSKLGKFDDAARELDEGAALIDRALGPNLDSYLTWTRGEIYRLRSEVYVKQHDYAAALLQCDRAVEDARRLRDQLHEALYATRLAEMLGTRADVRLKSGDIAGARKDRDEADRLIKEARDVRSTTSARSRRGDEVERRSFGKLRALARVILRAVVAHDAQRHTKVGARHVEPQLYDVGGQRDVVRDPGAIGDEPRDRGRRSRGRRTRAKCQPLRRAIA